MLSPAKSLSASSQQGVHSRKDLKEYSICTHDTAGGLDTGAFQTNDAAPAGFLACHDKC